MYKVGVDLGGTNIAVGVVDSEYKIIGRAKVKTNLPRPASEIFEDIANCVKMAVADAGLKMEDIESVGIGTPGSVNKTNGIIEFANNLGFENVPAQTMLEQLIGIKTFIDNDANCAALGEAKAGAGKGLNDFVAITLGTGVGSGIIINGKLINGMNFAAGEMGHMVITVGGLQCNCGRKGCWEKYASATALISQTQDAMKENPDSIMWQLAEGDLNKVTGRTAFDAMRNNDEVGKAVVENYIYYVAVGLANIINALQPEMICISGGISHEGETLLEPLRNDVYAEQYNKNSKIKTQICRAVLGNDAGIIGAALLDF